jgi:tRNA A-37 threonylcarbamoyl transferase component Bud32
MTFDNMKSHDIKGTKLQCTDHVLSTFQKLLHLIEQNPRILRPVKDMDEEARDLLATEGFGLYPTVKNTTLIYDDTCKCFIKVLHPLTLKKYISFLLIDRARRIYHVANYLFSRGIKMPQVLAYGKMRVRGLPFFVMEKVQGESLYEILVKRRETLDRDTYFKVMEQVADLHRLGYWYGDAHMSHIFLKDGKVSGFIDIDSIRRSRFIRLKNLAKDIAGLNHPHLSLNDESRKELLYHYLGLMDIQKKDNFIRLIKHFTERRWKGVKSG